MNRKNTPRQRASEEELELRYPIPVLTRSSDDAHRYYHHDLAEMGDDELVDELDAVRDRIAVERVPYRLDWLNLRFFVVQAEQLRRAAPAGAGSGGEPQGGPPPSVQPSSSPPPAPLTLPSGLSLDLPRRDGGRRGQ